MDNPRKYGNEPFTVAVVHGGPGALGEMAPVARELSLAIGVLEPLQLAATVDGQVEELRAILETSGNSPFILIGFSWGAWLSCILAAFHPQLVKKLILISSGPFDEKHASSVMKTRLQRLQGAQRKEAESLYLALGTPTSPDVEGLVRFGELTSKADSFDLLPDEGETAQLDLDIYRAIWDEASRLRRSGQLLEIVQQIKCPVVAIHGDYYPHPAEGVRDPLSRAIRDFRFVLLEKCGHYPWRESNAREAFYRVLKSEVKSPESGVTNSRQDTIVQKAQDGLARRWSEPLKLDT